MEKDGRQSVDDGEDAEESVEYAYPHEIPSRTEMGHPFFLRRIIHPDGNRYHGNAFPTLENEKFEFGLIS
jgi:hypothetical protein